MRSFVALGGNASLSEAKALAREGHCLAGSMGRKMASAIRFVEDGGTRAIVSSPDGAVDALGGRTGTRILHDMPAQARRASRRPQAVSHR